MSETAPPQRGDEDGVADLDATTPPATDPPPVDEPIVPSSPDPTSNSSQPHSYATSSIHLVAKLLPDIGDARGRAVVLGVTNDADAPIIQMVHLIEPTLPDLLPLLQELLNRLLDELPARYHAKIARETLSSSLQPTPVRLKEAKKSKAKESAVPSAAVARAPLPPAEPFQTDGATQQTLFDL